VPSLIEAILVGCLFGLEAFAEISELLMGTITPSKAGSGTPYAEA
jgi:hypothetical protein